MITPNSDTGATPETPTTLRDLGWKPFFQHQLAEQGTEAGVPVRIMQVHRRQIIGLGAGPGSGAEVAMPPLLGADGDPGGAATVGDWVLFDAVSGRATALLDRQSLFKRRAAGEGRQVQLIAANVDTAFIVTSCNPDFNIARLERYLALAHQADVTPVIVLTKPDLCDDPSSFVEQAAVLDRSLCIELVNALDPASAARLQPWCKPGQTVVFLGSSGVGKSTLVNLLAGRQVMATGGMREDDAKGRHTTTSRAMHRLSGGAWLLDTPGMREVQLIDVTEGLEAVFDDLTEIAQGCKFRDCLHDTEPGCAVRQAIAAGQIDAQRVERWRKLVAEDAHNNASLQERRGRERAFGKMVKATIKGKNR